MAHITWGRFITPNYTNETQLSLLLWLYFHNILLSPTANQLVDLKARVTKNQNLKQNLFIIKLIKEYTSKIQIWSWQSPTYLQSILSLCWHAKTVIICPLSTFTSLSFNILYLYLLTCHDKLLGVLYPTHASCLTSRQLVLFCVPGRHCYN